MNLRIGMDGDIEPGLRIGEIQIGQELASLSPLLPRECQRVLLEGSWLYTFQPFQIWISKEDAKVEQISVEKGFVRKFLGDIGIGSTLLDLQREAGEYYEWPSAYYLKGFAGICFELQDVDDWDERTTPIEYISVYDVAR